MVKAILSYVPVVHRGYLDFFKRHIDAYRLYIFGEELIGEFDHLRKEIRALTPDEASRALCLADFPLAATLKIAGKSDLALLRKGGWEVVMPDEDISRELARRHLRGCQVEFDSVFLRWDRKNSLRDLPVNYDRKVPLRGLTGELMRLAAEASRKASNWWRQVGAVAAKNGRVLLIAHNTHAPSPHLPYFEGDPRNNFKRGVHIELSTDHHAEARLISEAARRGIALSGADLYVTTFPCPPCAKLIAYSGVRRLYYGSGYAMLDGERILKANSVEIILVASR